MTAIRRNIAESFLDDSGAIAPKVTRYAPPVWPGRQRYFSRYPVRLAETRTGTANATRQSAPFRAGLVPPPPVGGSFKGETLRQVCDGGGGVASAVIPRHSLEPRAPGLVWVRGGHHSLARRADVRRTHSPRSEPI